MKLGRFNFSFLLDEGKFQFKHSRENNSIIDNKF